MVLRVLSEQVQMARPDGVMPRLRDSAIEPRQLSVFSIACHECLNVMRIISIELALD